MTPLVPLLIVASAAEAWIAPGPAPSAPQTTAQTSAAPGDAVSRRLTALELALSATMVQPPTQWRFGRLREEARAIAQAATREADRAAAREIAQRIDRFAAIASRSPAGGPVGGRRPTGERIAPPVQLTKAPAETNPERRPAHDAVGVLRPVVSKRPGAPKYAVVDDKGRLAALVTPSPEVAPRFEQLLGRRVGLDGKRGYLTDLRREHLTVERVTALPTLRR